MNEPPNIEDEFFANDPDAQSQRRERIAALSRSKTSAEHTARYSKFIRHMKMAMPLIALAITAIVFTWSNVNDDNIIPVKAQDALPKTIGRNELLNPRFESMDTKKQPYSITAARAVQGEADTNLVMLEKPTGNMQLSSGNMINMEADQGSFKQDERKLMLRGDVEIYHDKGYTLKTSELQIDMDSNSAVSDKDVNIEGPAGTLNAKGLRADNNEGYLVFNGPANLVLTGSGADLQLGKPANE